MTDGLPSSVVHAHERDGVVVCDVFIAAPPEAVYPYLVDARLQERWMGRDVQLDPRPGGVTEGWVHFLGRLATHVDSPDVAPAAGDSLDTTPS